MAQIAGDEGSAEWTSSRPASRGKVKAAWLADAVARADAKRRALTAERAEKTESKKPRRAARSAAQAKTSSKDTAHKVAAAKDFAPKSRSKKFPANSASSTVKALAGAEQRPMPTVIHPMLASSVAKAFDDPDWLFEIKWDGYRAVAFIEDGRVRLVSRNQNDLTAQFSELGSLPQFVNAQRAILDGEIVALDEEGRPSFSLIQQRTGLQPGKRRLARREAPSSADWKAFLPRSAAASTRRSARTIGSKSKSRSDRSASLEATRIRRAAANILARLCLACTTSKDASFTLAKWAPASIRRRSKKCSLSCRGSRRNRIRFTARLADCEKFSSCGRNWLLKSSLRSGLTRARKVA